MSEKHYPYYGGNFDRIIFDGDGSAWVQEAKLRDAESENASLRGAAQGLGRLCDRYKAENKRLRACLGDGCADCAIGMGEYADSLCDPLKAENAKLREQSERLFDKTLELATENSKLRELVLVMWDVALHPQLFGDGSYWLERMSELGIEEG